MPSSSTPNLELNNKEMTNNAKDNGFGLLVTQVSEQLR
jgi:hypothetical protein